MELFGTAGIRGDAVEEVTPAVALSVGRALGERVRERSADGTAGSGASGGNGPPTVVVGRDGRVTGPALAAAAAAGLASAGVAVRRLGVVPTPAVAFASRGRHGLAVTASHNPPGDNGLKLFADGVEFDRGAERDVAARVGDADGAPAPAPWAEWTEPGREAVLDGYRGAVVSYARDHGAALDGLRVALDCGTGTAALAAPEVLRTLGARVVTLNAQIDGHFPGRASKPTPDSLSDFRAFVAEDDAALGIAHDGDADRIVVLDGSGEVVHEDTVVAILAEHYVRASSAEAPAVVTTPNASGRIDERVRAAGGRVERTRLGALHEGVAAVRAEGGTVAFAAEPWKHLHPGLGGWIDGVASAAVLARLVAASGLADLRAPVDERPYRKGSVPCADGRKADAMDRVADALPAAFPDAETDDEYGVRVDRPDGSWVLVRPSGTEPYLRVYAESEDADALIDRVTDLVAEAVAAADERR
ncbi:MAG: phosphomannomutase [Haloferacaceae archaeon]